MRHHNVNFQPTEAIKVSTWKELEDSKNASSKVISRYHLELKIYSTTALFVRHHPAINYNKTSDLCPNCKRHDYPRTGNHIIHDMFNSSTAFPVYFFFEGIQTAHIVNSNVRHWFEFCLWTYLYDLQKNIWILSSYLIIIRG